MFQRLKRIWKLSEELPEEKKEKELLKSIQENNKASHKRMAMIIKSKKIDPLEDFIKQDEQ